MKEDIKEEMIFKLYDKFKDEIFEMSEEERKVVKELDIKVNEFIKIFEDNELSFGLGSKLKEWKQSWLWDDDEFYSKSVWGRSWREYYSPS